MPKKAWLRAVVEQNRKVGLSESDANSRSRLSLGANAVSIKMRSILPPPLFGEKSGCLRNRTTM